MSILNLLYRLFKLSARKVLGTTTHVLTRDPVAALSFDDGPHPEFTPRLLDILARHQAHGSFFMIGKSAKRYPEVVRQVADAGHAIGNHSWDHSSFPLISGRERRAQIRACENAIVPYGVRLFRPPYGHQDFASHLDAVLLGYRVVTWSSVAQDWLDHDAAWIAGRIVNEIYPGSIILLHDGLYHYLDERYADRGAMLEAVDMVLTRLAGRFQFVTIPELFRRGRPFTEGWYKVADIDFLNALKAEQSNVRRYSQ